MSEKLAESLKATKTVTELFDALANGVGSDAYKHFEDLVEGQFYEERRFTEKEFTPWTTPDIDLLERLVPLASQLPQTNDPVPPATRLQTIIDSMKDLKLRAERGY